MKLKKKKTLPIIFITIIILIAVAFSLAWKARNNNYIYISPRRGNLVEAIYGLGKVKSYRKYDVKVGIMTKVQKVFVKEGQTVKKDDPLIKFTDTAIFPAPFNGTVTAVPYNAPDTILPQISALTMQDLNDKYLEVSLEQEGALRVTKGQNAKVLFESVRGEIFKGRVEAIFPKNDEFLAHINVEGLEKNVMPGMTADVSIIVGQHQNVLQVPVSGLSNGHLILKRENKKMKIPVKIGGIDGEWAEVVEGDVQMTDKILLKVDNKSSKIKEQSSALLGH